MHNKISALALAVFFTGHCFALELTPGEIIIQQEAVLATPRLENIAVEPTRCPVPSVAFINTTFGKIIGQFEGDEEGYNYKKLELLLKQRVFDHGAIIAPFTAVTVPFFLTLLLPLKISSPYACAGFLGLSQVVLMYRNNKGQTDSIFYKHTHDTTINLEKDENGNWKVVNSIYDEETNLHIALLAAALEKGERPAELYAPLEKVFTAQKN